MTEFRPLYAQIRDALIHRISAGEWPPGTAIPAELSLAAEFGVSPGTARKAIDHLCETGDLVRAQGRGTFVAEQTPEMENFRFFPLIDAAGSRVVPSLLTQSASTVRATGAQVTALEIEPTAMVHLIERVRAIDGVPVIDEMVAVPAVLMPGLAGAADGLPNALYPHFQAQFGVSVLTTDDRVSAVIADDRLARRLDILPETALLRAERIARDLTGRAVEHRISHFVTTHHFFSVSLKSTPRA